LATGQKDEVGHPHFRESIVVWNAGRQQTYPWREGRSDPWTVLMGELLLTRTRPVLVTAMLGRLRELAPDPGALVSQPDAIARLESLGLGARSHILLEVALDVVERFGGHVPDDEHDLRSLPGVGEHIVLAVRCFAFRKRAVLLDSATERLLGRYVGRGDLRRWQKRLDLHRLAGQPGPDAAFNRAVLELALGTCRAEKPLCGECPLSHDCASADTESAGVQLLLVSGGASAA
jgi:A/G-specific adenine glycosylase